MTVLEMRDVRKEYGEVTALDGMDLAVEQGEIVAVLGPNGAGKTTTFELLLGLIRPTAGSVRILGEEPGPRVRGRIGAMLQSAGLPEQVTVRELVRLIGRSYPQSLDVDDVLASTGLTKRARRAVTTLSGGERQRVLLALALVGAPQLLLLDEPTAAMDVEVRRAFWASMREFTAGGRTVLFATHYLQEADQFADRVVVLARGVLVADGTGAQIKSTVAGRTISAVVDGSATESLGALPGVLGTERQGARTLLHCNDSDTALRALLAAYPQAHDIEIAAGNLEDAFLELVATSRQEAAR